MSALANKDQMEPNAPVLHKSQMPTFLIQHQVERGLLKTEAINFSRARTLCARLPADKRQRAKPLIHKTEDWLKAQEEKAHARRA